MAEDPDTDDEAQTDEREETDDHSEETDTGPGLDDVDESGKESGVTGEPTETDEDLDWDNIEGEIEEDLDWGEDDTPDGLDWADDAGTGDDISWAEDDGENGEGLAWANEEDSAGTKPFPTTADETDPSDDAGGSQDDSLAPADEETTLPDDDMDQAFDDMVDDVETDEVWSEVTDEENGEMIAEDQPTTDEPEVDTSIAEVSKHDYCESCEYFSKAPEIRCTHDGTEIVDFPDMETVRVSDCPIVAERQGLEQGVAKGSTDLGEIQRD